MRIHYKTGSAIMLGTAEGERKSANVAAWRGKDERQKQRGNNEIEKKLRPIVCFLLSCVGRKSSTAVFRTSVDKASDCIRTPWTAAESATQ